MSTTVTFDSVKNLVKVGVSTGYDNLATSILLNTGLGAILPLPSFNMTWWNNTDYGDPSDDPNVEIIRVTGVSGDTISIVRAQEATTASTKNTANKNYSMILPLTALTLSNVINSVVVLSASIDELQTGFSKLVEYLIAQDVELPDELLSFLD